MRDSLLPVLGSPGSPYTRKMLATLRFRRIPYRFMQGGLDDIGRLPKPKVKLIPIFFFADESGELEAVVDSTPIIRRLEQEYPGRSVIPGDPVMAMVNYLLEDYCDEWLTKAMFHYRWYYHNDIDLAGSVLPHYGNVSQPDEKMAEMKQVFSDRQISRLYVVGSNDTTAGVIEDSYKRFLVCLNNHLKTHPFMMGDRPGSSDFGCFGQLTQLVQFDPTPSKIATASFPRVHAWVSKMEDQSGLEVTESGFFGVDAFPETLTEMLKEVGRTYVPVMLANASAIEGGLDSVETVVEGKAWHQEPFPYQAKCLQQLRIEYAKLDEKDQQRVNVLVAGTGCEKLFVKPGS